METSPAPYALGPEEGEARWGVDGALTTVKATGEQTGGRVAVIEDMAPRGEGTPLHAHRDDDETTSTDGEGSKAEPATPAEPAAPAEPNEAA